MPFAENLIAFAKSVRTDRRANPGIAGDGTALELLLAPRFQSLMEACLHELFPNPPSVLPEYRLGGIGRPDLAFAGPGQPARAFVELKEPGKSIKPADLRGHDADQFKRFSELPIWALSNFSTLNLYHRKELVEPIDVLPAAALDPRTPDNVAERMIHAEDHSGFGRVLEALTWAGPPTPTDAGEVAETLAHAARLVREVIAAHCRAGLTGVLARVRDEFNDTLFARPEAGGYDPTEGDALFASAFAQTLIFGLLMAREAGNGAPISDSAYQLLPVGTYPLLRGTLRALTLDEVRDALGVAYTIARDAANAVAPDLLRTVNGRDPMLYLYEDFLRVFDPDAVTKYGVYYTPPEVVQLIVSEIDHALRDGLGSQGLLDPRVNLLDPACGTGTFLIASAGLVATQAAARFGTGSVGAEITGFAQRMNGFEILVGPYTVAHYRMLREVKGGGGTVAHLPIFLADTLAPPAGTAGVTTHLDFMGAPMVAEREAADTLKRDTPILAIMGNPPYRRLRSGEVARLVGAHIGQLWDDLKRPVREAGLQRSLNAFPDLYVAFYRWALWRLFETEHAARRGAIGFITNRGFLTGPGFGGLRRMLRERFDFIRIIDFRGNNKGTIPADVERDENVFNIEVGVCVLIAYATGEKPDGVGAEVRYADVWSHNCFRRTEKLALASSAARDRNLIPDKVVQGTGMDRLKLTAFRKWIGRVWMKRWCSARTASLRIGTNSCMRPHGCVLRTGFNAGWRYPTGKPNKSSMTQHSTRADAPNWSLTTLPLSNRFLIGLWM